MRAKILSILLFLAVTQPFAHGKPRGAFTLADVVERVSPGVVNIQARVPSSANDEAGVLRRRERVDKFFQMFLLPGMPSETGESKSLGSGFYYKSSRWIVTNLHVVKDARSIDLVNADGSRDRAKILGFDSKNDLALLVLPEPNNMTVLKMGSSEKLRIGDPVFAIGNPFGFGHTVTSGILSAKGRTIGSGPLDDFLQIDAAINPGNSGGPLFNLKGEVIGINTAVTAEGNGISFAITSETAIKSIENILNNRKEKFAWLGVVGSNIDDAEASTAVGVVVQNIVRDSPAEKSGLKTGDVIMRLQNKPAKNVGAVQKALRKLNAGEKISIGVFRGGEQVKLTIPTSSAPESSAESF